VVNPCGFFAFGGICFKVTFRSLLFTWWYGLFSYLGLIDKFGTFW